MALSNCIRNTVKQQQKTLTEFVQNRKSIFNKTLAIPSPTIAALLLKAHECLCFLQLSTAQNATLSACRFSTVWSLCTVMTRLSLVTQWPTFYFTSPRGSRGRGEVWQDSACFDPLQPLYIFNASEAQDSFNCSLFSDFCVGCCRIAGAAMPSKRRKRSESR